MPKKIYNCRLIEIETANPMEILNDVALEETGMKVESDAEMDVSMVFEVEQGKLYETAVEFLKNTRAGYFAKMEETQVENVKDLVEEGLNLVDKEVFSAPDNPYNDESIQNDGTPFRYLGNGHYENCFSTFYVVYV